ncbi:killer toxin alpha/beta [Diplogelasinospora grovesii]|uniref:chitinase n=1 Tax=Diplogelasinospora grovesii TaxID=303347 RepID=A0AAN6S4T9_9PEZI|nr:killer toxin alpha/beta [Diplogelasinospora grovesii]
MATVSVQTDAFLSALRPCPATCAGSPENWTVYTALNRLDVCNQPVLLDFAIYNPLDDPTTTVKLRTCTIGNANDTQNALLANSTTATGSAKRAEPVLSLFPRDNSSLCIAKSETKTITLDLAVSSGTGRAAAKNLHNALDTARTYLTDSSNCDTEFIVGWDRHAAVAVYSGAAIDNSATAAAVVERLMAEAGTGDEPAPGSMLVQLCGGGRNADYVMGIAVDTTGDWAGVQRAVTAWSDGTCVNGTQPTSQLKDVNIVEKPLLLSANGTTHANGTLANNGTAPVHARHLYARADCTTTTVVSGDSCGSLASKCGITAAQFTQYNPSSSLCSSLAVGQKVCCSAGTLPDTRPKQNPDGSCASYTVQTGDYCALIAASNSLQVSDISTFNDGTTWGWSGCSNLFAGIKICLSTGTPPMPAPQSNAVCGPIVPGTAPPTSGQSLASLNPCPLNSCCDIWGQCGITPEFCTPTPGATNNPGTAPPGQNGCVSNCGTDVVNNAQGPSEYMQIGYYESWNWDRDCLNYNSIDLSITQYTHAHWGFASVASGSFDIIVNDTYNQMPNFINLQQKKILSFGGWGFSTDPSTFEILRTAMQPANSGTFAQKIVDYLNANGFDGVDIDWEYPGAPDIPGIPAGLATDGPYYLHFLSTLRSKMPAGKTISIAAPASFWYLRAFPIAQMAQFVDYIVYMTYDLHGQWDYGNQFSQDGCPSGNCLRSHVNITETKYALAMITKAGVPSNKIAVGVSSYGRSFGMTQPGCIGPTCPFSGPDSTAEPGQCTVTAGYISNAEIDDLINLDDATTISAYDAASDSNILVYGSTWVAYMDDTTKASRVSAYQALNFAGTVDWAVDLQAFTDDDGSPDGSDDEDDLPDSANLSPCTDTYNTIDDLDAAADSIPDHCATIYTLQVLRALLSQTLSNYTDMIDNQGYDGKFNTYSKAVADSAGQQVHDFVYSNGDKYFSCVVAEISVCCDYCKDGVHPAQQCNYCFDGACEETCIVGITCPQKRWSLPNLDPRESGPGNGGGGSTTTVMVSHWVNETEPCPPDYSQRGYGPDNPYVQSIYWTLTDEDGFYGDLLSNTGIPKDKIAFQNVDRGVDCAPSSQPTDQCWASGMDWNMPVASGFSQGDVANPKDIVQQGLSKTQGLGPQIDGIINAMQLDGWYGDAYDLLDSLALPIFMLAEATMNMASIETVADKIDEERRKAIILAFLGAILFIVPVVGEVVGSIAELGDIAAIISALGAAGNAAMDIYTIVDDPANAPLAIFDLVLSPLALADAAVLAKAAAARRSMAAGDIAKLGERVESRMGTVEKITGACFKDE